MPEIFRVLTLIAALAITGVGAVLGFLSAAMALVSSGPDTLSFVTLGASLSVLSLALGSASAWQAWQAIRGISPALFRPRRTWPLVILYLLALALGQAMLTNSFLPSLAFPLLHVAAAMLPALLILALIGRALSGATTWREMVLQTASGAFLATPLAFFVEMAAILVLVSAALLGLAWQPGGQTLLLRVTAHLQDLSWQDPSWIEDPGALVSNLLSPIAIAAAFAIMSGIVPIIEETLKTIGVAIAACRRPSRQQAMLWGAAAGAGFAITEGLLNAAVDLGTWLPIAVARVGATLLHCATGVLMGLAWYHVARHRWPRGLALYLISILIHGLWNGLALSMTLLSLSALGAGPAVADQMMASLGILGIMLLLGILALGIAIGLAGLVLHARRQALAPVSATGQLGTADPKTSSSSRPSAQD